MPCLETAGPKLVLVVDEFHQQALETILTEVPDDLDAATALKACVTDDVNALLSLKDISASMVADLVGEALEQVNWLEIIQAHRS